MATYVTPMTATRMTAASSALVPKVIVLITSEDEDGYLSGMKSAFQGVAVKQVYASKIDTLA